MPPSESAPKRIILVEDNPSDVFLLQRALEQYNVANTMEVVQDGEAALKYLAQLQAGRSPLPDLMILDLNLPRHDGIEVLARCRQEGAFPDMPIIVLTSSDSPDERRRAEKFGISDYVRKPIMLDEFMAVGGRVKRLFEGRSATP